MSSDDKNPKTKKLKRYYNVDDSKLDEIEGLESIVDSLVDDEEKKIRKRHNKEVEKYGESYELYNYLEVERKRLGILDDFMSNKIPNMKQHSQTQTLVTKQEECRAKLRKELSERMVSKSSRLMKQMAYIFEKSFTGQGQE